MTVSVHGVTIIERQNLKNIQKIYLKKGDWLIFAKKGNTEKISCEIFSNKTLKKKIQVIIKILF